MREAIWILVPVVIILACLAIELFIVTFSNLGRDG